MISPNRKKGIIRLVGGEKDDKNYGVRRCKMRMTVTTQTIQFSSMLTIIKNKENSSMQKIEYILMDSKPGTDVKFTGKAASFRKQLRKATVHEDNKPTSRDPYFMGTRFTYMMKTIIFTKTTIRSYYWCRIDKRLLHKASLGTIPHKQKVLSIICYNIREKRIVSQSQNTLKIVGIRVHNTLFS